jgi:hypothetical protein
MPIGLADGDACCPAGANANNDADCAPECGNDITEAGEECDGGQGCDADCALQLTADQRRCLDSFADDECERCSCIQCTPQALQCRDGGNATLNMQCVTLIDCARASQCSRDPCYCGSADIFTCATAPAGPCIPEVEAAAGSQNALDIAARQDDPAFAIGRANALGDCSLTQCANVCP